MQLLQIDSWLKRKLLIRNYCQTNNKREPNLELIVQVKELNLDWCMVPKIASSSISNLLLPFLPNEPFHKNWPYIHYEVLRRGGNLKKSTYKPSKTVFVVARHPFDRLVSAYKDKLENRTKNKDGRHFYKKESKKIIK